MEQRRGERQENKRGRKGEGSKTSAKGGSGDKWERRTTRNERKGEGEGREGGGREAYGVEGEEKKGKKAMEIGRGRGKEKRRTMKVEGVTENAAKVRGRWICSY